MKAVSRFLEECPIPTRFCRSDSDCEKNGASIATGTFSYEEVSLLLLTLNEEDHLFRYRCLPIFYISFGCFRILHWISCLK